MLPLGHGFDCSMHVTSKKSIGNRATTRILPLLPYNGPCYHLMAFASIGNGTCYHLMAFTSTIAAGSSEAIIYVEVLMQMASAFSAGKFSFVFLKAFSLF